MKRSAIGVSVVAVVAVVSCVDEGAGWQGKKIDPAYIQENLIKQDALPELARLDIDVGGKAIYIGNTAKNPTTKADVDALAPGAVVQVAHYWQVTTPPGPDWRVFAFVKGAPGTADFMSLTPTDMEQGHPPASWRAGEIIRDLQDFALRPDWHSSTATLYVGLIAAGKHGTTDRMAVRGANTFDRAIIARTFQVDLSHAPPPPGTIYVQRAQGPIMIDGLANDPGWAGVVASPEFVSAEGAKNEPVGKATAKMTWDDANLYLFVQIADTDIFSEYKKHDDKVYLEDCIEIFIDADGNRKGYVELQVNPNNATFDSWFPSGKVPHGDEAWDSNMATAVQVHGTADVAGDQDTGWEVEIAIPWAAVKGKDDQMAVRLPPQVGDRWKLNIVRVDGKYPDKNYTASSWNRISISDFHGLDRMLTAVFADTTGAIVAKKPTEDAPPPAQGSGSAAGSGAQGSGAQGSGGRPNVEQPNTGSATGSNVPRANAGSAGGSNARPNAGSAAGSNARPNAGSGSATRMR